MKPWEHQIPPVLYKFLPPQRFHILTDCRVRFTQRACLPDDHELLPNVVDFGTPEEIERLKDAGSAHNKFAKFLLLNPSLQAHALQGAKDSMKSPDQFGVFCMTDKPYSGRMWEDYAAGGTGFVVGFDTTCFAFRALATPGKIGRVSYGDEPIGTFLSLVEGKAPEIFFRKRKQFAYEQEWRSIRFLDRLERHGDIFLSQFHPDCVCEIIVRSNCPLENVFRHFLAVDSRYRRVRLTVARD